MGMYCELRTVEQTDAENPVRMSSTGLLTSHAVSLEKAWHGLHFLLTGSAIGGDWPLNFLLFGGEMFGSDESIRRLQPDAVREVQLALARISDEQLWAQFDSTRMIDEGLYPVIWDEPEDELKQEYLMYFRELKYLFEQAAATGSAVTIRIA